MLAAADQASRKLDQSLKEGRVNLVELEERQRALVTEASEQVEEMNFQFLYDSKRSLFSIGYFVNERRRDTSYYDLLASEARLGSFVAIAKGDVPQEHWFHLGRALTPVGTNSAALISWSGTMFEYLMPLLVMRNYPETLLDQTYKAAVARQQQYGRRRKVPWGISESAYNARDLNQNYQYQAHGVPGLGLKRGLGSELVIAPYASIMALSVQPRATLANIRELIAEGMQGNYGLYEALDYTVEVKGRPHNPLVKNKTIVRSFMVHHQAMSLLALNNYLHQDVMQRRFHSEPMVRATQMLLQEQFPSQAPRQKLPEIATESRVIYTSSGIATRQFTTPHTPVPYTHLLSNGKYTVVLTNSGAGFSRYNGLAVTRWHEDSTRDNWGNFCYIRDTGSKVTWSAAYQPTCHDSHNYHVVYSLHKAEFQQQMVGIETHLEVTVSPVDNAEVRHLSLINLTSITRELEVTSYAEIVLAPAAADNAHPAFSNLFIETEFLPEQNALLASRRPRSPDQTRVWGVHVVAVRGHTVGAIQYETDRAAFLGRATSGNQLTPHPNGSKSEPAALQKALSNTTGAVLDPIFSLRRRVRIVPGGTVHLTFTTAVAESREQALQLADKYHDHNVIARTFELAWTDSQVELSQLNLSAEEVHRFQRLSAHAIYADPWLRAEQGVLAQNTQGQPTLWKYGISGDYPIILVKLGSGEELSLVRELLLAHEYWRINDLKVDLVIFNKEAGGYNQGLQEQLLGIIRSSRANGWLDRPGGVFVLRGDIMPESDGILLQTVARAVLL
jgi:cyclic beta-1,2-glucan synthetase